MGTGCSLRSLIPEHRGTTMRMNCVYQMPDQTDYYKLRLSQLPHGKA